jgi:hypothetical protein
MFALASMKKPGALPSVLLGLLVVLTAAGCGGRTGRVSGTVSYRSRLLPGGTILLLASDGRAYDGPIGSDGRFAISDVPAGEARVSVTSLTTGEERKRPGEHYREAMTPRRTDHSANSSSRLPTRYGDLGQSGLTVKVQGDTTLELDLK